MSLQDKHVSASAPKKAKLANEEVECRSVKYDLEVKLGKNGESRRVSSAVMATFSNYIDAVMVSSMKESKSKCLTFPDIEPKVWDNMVKWLVKPAEILDMTVSDAVLVAQPYHKYQFNEGYALCEQVFVKYLESLGPRIESGSVQLDLLVHLMSMTRELSMRKAYGLTKVFLNGVLRGQKDPLVPSSFTTSHVGQLVPIFGDLVHDKFLTPMELLPSEAGHEITQQQLKESLFPSVFVQSWNSMWQMKFMKSLAGIRRRPTASRFRVEVTTTSHLKEMNGCFKECRLHPSESAAFEKHPPMSMSSPYHLFGISTTMDAFPRAYYDMLSEPEGLEEVPKSAWFIFGHLMGDEYDTTVLLWYAPYSSGQLLPPGSGWKQVDEQRDIGVELRIESIEVIDDEEEEEEDEENEE